MEQRLNRLIRLSELPLYVGLRRTQIGELIKAGEFPRPIPLSDTGRAVAWLEADIVAWQARRLAKREAERA
jgi:predicted DNA-binding transcriptional regulator AlpA